MKKTIETKYISGLGVVWMLRLVDGQQIMVKAKDISQVYSNLCDTGTITIVLNTEERYTYTVEMAFDELMDILNEFTKEDLTFE